jgi:hypothetical protein
MHKSFDYAVVSDIFSDAQPGDSDIMDFYIEMECARHDYQVPPKIFPDTCSKSMFNAWNAGDHLVPGNGLSHLKNLPSL